MNQPQEQAERSYRRPGKKLAAPQGSRCTCSDCLAALRMRATVWGDVDAVLRE